jgi:hypothetical protein
MPDNVNVHTFNQLDIHTLELQTTRLKLTLKSLEEVRAMIDAMSPDK